MKELFQKPATSYWSDWCRRWIMECSELRAHKTLENIRLSARNLASLFSRKVSVEEKWLSAEYNRNSPCKVGFDSNVYAEKREFGTNPLAMKAINDIGGAVQECKHWDYKATWWLAIVQIRGLQRDVVYLGWPTAPSDMSPNAGEGGSCRVSANEYSCTQEPK